MEYECAHYISNAYDFVETCEAFELDACHATASHRNHLKYVIDI